MTDPLLLDDDQRSALSAHAAAIAYRLLGDHLAAEQLASRTVDALAARFSDTPDDSPGDGPAPMAWLASATVEAALDAEPSADGTDGPRRAALRLALRGLSADHRAVVALTLLCGYPRPEVATWTGRSTDEVDAVIAELPSGVEGASDLPRHAGGQRRRRIRLGSIAAIVMLAAALIITNCQPFVDDADGRAISRPASAGSR